MNRERVSTGLLVLLTISLFLFQPVSAGEKVPQASKGLSITPELFEHLEWRNIGPANMMGRTADIEGVPENPNILYAGTASGGVWKTVNGGVTWAPVFDTQPVVSIGDLALEPGNPDVVYVGTGESNVRNSVSFGNGVYKSTDGGKTWKHLGLDDTRHISRIIVNPANPSVVFVGALGHAFGPNRERGVFKSTDGGQTWKKVLYTDERHGVSDMDINPSNPNIVFAGLWRFERKPWTFESGDEEGGLFRSVDGGDTWNKVTKGLPKLVGRIGVKVSWSNPEVVYVMAESQEGTLFRSDDMGETFRCVSKDLEIVSRGFYYTDLRVDPADENRVYAVASRLSVSIDGGKSFKRISPSTHVDFHSLWIDPENPNRIWQAQDGGVAVSYDRGKTWEYVNNFPAGQFYQIYADNRKPFYWVGGGMQDNGTWFGPSRTRERFGILNDDWRMISFGDGFHIVSHPENPELFVSESQGGSIVRTDMRTREQQNISPQPRRADGAPVSALKYRFNWNTPIILSPHDKNTLFVGGNVVFRSVDFGTSWTIISPDLTTDNPEKQKSAGGPAWPENTTAEYHCTIISLAESPVQPGIIWAGTDDGNLQVSADNGESWKNVVKNVPGLAPFSPVSHVEPSRSSAGKAYSSFDRHMLDDLKPYVFKTENFGETWTNITGNLPSSAYVWVVREDPRNPNIVYAGTELGIFASWTGGGAWIKIHMKNLPTVSVHDILIHPEENDIILGTHGRSLWILDDIFFIQELSQEFLLGKPAHVFASKAALRYATKPTRYGIGDKVFRGANPPYGAVITYYLKEKLDKDAGVRLQILNQDGKVIREINKLSREKGLNRTVWDLRHEGPRQRREQEEEEEDFFFRGPRGPLALPGNYTVRLVTPDGAVENPLEVRLDPAVDFAKDDAEELQKYGFRLCGMQSFINDGLRALDSLLRQLEEREKTVKGQKDKFPEEVLKIIEEHKKKIESLEALLTRPEGKAFWSEGPQILGRVGSLFWSLDGVHALPTPAQVEYFLELEREFESAMEEVNGYLKDTGKEINTQFNKNQVPLLVVPEPMEFKKSAD